MSVYNNRQEKEALLEEYFGLVRLDFPLHIILTLHWSPSPLLSFSYVIVLFPLRAQILSPLTGVEVTCAERLKSIQALAHAL